MKLSLRPYQDKFVKDIRLAMREHRTVAAMLPTGGGKSHIFAAITSMAYEKKNRVWICVPRNDLIWQTSEHLFNRKIPHGLIKAGTNESRAYNVHVISMETIKRRLKDGKIKNFPDLLIFDECHIQLDAQIKIVSQLPETTRVIGFSATMERLDGRGLGINENNGKKDGLYGTLVEGPTIRDLIEMKYLSPFRYFCPPLEGLDEVHRKGTEFDANELEALLKKRAVYGKAIEHYKKFADGKRALVFCRSVKSSEETAARFREAGYRFESIDGRMSDKKRKELIDALKSGKLQGLCNCEIATFGLDVPAVEVGIMLRPTMSLSLYFQIIGRVLRVFPGKKEAIILDHVNNLANHFYPLEDYEWEFYGKEKRGKKKGLSKDILRLCPSCWMYFTGSSCPNCGNVKAPRKANGLVEVDGRLVEHKGPIPLKERPQEEQKEFHDRIADAKARYEDKAALGEIDTGVVKELLELCDEIGRSYMWTYHTLNNLENAVNVPLLTAIANTSTAKKKKYRYYWVKIKRQELQKRNATAGRSLL